MIGHRRIKVYEDNGDIHETDIYLPNIRSVVGFLEGVWDYSVYDSCFDRSTKMGDVDGQVEAYGHTMTVEFKRTRHDITRGQLMKAVRQARYSNTTTFFVFGETNRPVEYLRFSPNCLQGTGFIKCDIQGLSKAFRAWNNWAKANSKLEDDTLDWSIVRRYLNSVGGGKSKR